MATTTGTVGVTTAGYGWCAEESAAAGIFSLQGLWQAYEACQRRKLGTRDAQRYDQELLDHLVDLIDTQQASATRGWRWFARKWPRLLGLVQSGCGFELYDHQVWSLGRWLSSALDPLPCPSFSGTLFEPLTRLRGFRCDLRRGVIAHPFLVKKDSCPAGPKRSLLRFA